MAVGGCGLVQLRLPAGPASLWFCMRRLYQTVQLPEGSSTHIFSLPFFWILALSRKMHIERPRGSAFRVRVCADCGPGHSSWVFSEWELEPSDWRSASEVDLSCSESCSLLGMEFFFGRPFGLVGDSRPPPCNTCRSNMSFGLGSTVVNYKKKKKSWPLWPQIIIVAELFYCAVVFSSKYSTIYIPYNKHIH